MNNEFVSRKAGAKGGTEIGMLATVFPSELGWMFLAWHEATILRLSFGFATRNDAAQSCQTMLPEALLLQSVSKPVKRWQTRLQAFAEGKHDDLLDMPLCFDHLTEFQLKVTKACRAIPWGETRSYADLAEAAGSSAAARAVGNVMRANRYPLIVPCHRVIGSDGNLCGFTSPQGLSMKERLLVREQTENPLNNNCSS